MKTKYILKMCVGKCRMTSALIAGLMLPTVAFATGSGGVCGLMSLPYENCELLLSLFLLLLENGIFTDVAGIYAGILNIRRRRTLRHDEGSRQYVILNPVVRLHCNLLRLFNYCRRNIFILGAFKKFGKNR